MGKKKSEFEPRECKVDTLESRSSKLTAQVPHTEQVSSDTTESVIITPQ